MAIDHQQSSFHTPPPPPPGSLFLFLSLGCGCRVDTWTGTCGAVTTRQRTNEELAGAPRQQPGSGTGWEVAPIPAGNRPVNNSRDDFENEYSSTDVDR